MNNDNSKRLRPDITRQVSEAAQVPVIARAGSTMKHFVEVFQEASRCFRPGGQHFPFPRNSDYRFKEPSFRSPNPHVMSELDLKS